MHLGCEDGKAAPSSQTDRRNGASTWVLKGQDGELPLAVPRDRDSRFAPELVLKGFPEAITAAFPQATVQTCIVHLVRHSLNFCAWTQGRGRRPAPGLRGRHRRSGRRRTGRVRGKMGREIRVSRPGLAPGLARGDLVLCLRSGDPAIPRSARSSTRRMPWKASTG